MKTRRFALCLATVFLVAIYINIQRKYSSDRDTLRVECKSAVFHADFLLLRLSRFSNSTGSAASS